MMDHPKITRRAFFRDSTLAAASLALPLSSASATAAGTKVEAVKAEEVERAALFNEYRYGHMVQEYYVRRLREITRRRREIRSALRTSGQVMRFRDEVRRKLRRCFGRLPRRTPLNARITGKVEREHYTIEKVIYESRPNYLVTANLYLPKKGNGRMPAVLGACGHSWNGKAYAAYQEFSRNLARQGYVVLIYDPPAQGERTEYPDSEGSPRIGFGVHSHNVAGNQMTLCGRNFALWEAWDGVRGLDYLLSRPEVDAERIGVTGSSGGGTQTTNLNALDDRFTMAAPSCFVTCYRYNLEGEEPTDAEQILPGALSAELDMADFFLAQIPRPTLLVGELNDFFDVRGLRETYEELRRLYAIVGAEKNIELYVGPGPHGYDKEAREAMYRFFNKHAGVDASPLEPDQPVEKDEVLQVTPEGQVHLMNSRRAFDFTQRAARQLAERRKAVAGEALVRQIVEHLGLPERSGPPHYRVMRGNVIWNKPRVVNYGFAVETEPGIQALLHAIVKTGPLYYFPEGEGATLYVPHRSALKEVILGLAPEDPDGPALFALDVRGMGQLTARTCKDSGDDFFHYYHSDYMYANYGLMLNESYGGRRVHDLLRGLDLFQAHGYRGVHLVGRGMGAITATFAAAVHPLVEQVTLHNALLSYHELTQTPRYSWPLSAMVFGILKSFDLPDCLRELATRKKLTVINPWDSQMRPWPKGKLGEHLKALGLDMVEVRWSAGS